MTRATSQESFAWWDAWILLAVIYATRSTPTASLTAIIGVGDFIEHAILTRGELETGLKRLIEAGMLTHTENGFLLGERAQRFWAELEGREGTVRKDLDATASFLGSTKWEPGGLPNPPTQDYVSKEQYEAAADEYQRSTRAAQKSRRKQHDA
jgi:hypothetical protein